MEGYGHEKMKVLWEVVNNNVVEEPTDREEIGIQGFDFNVFNKDEDGVVREGSSEFLYLLMLIKLWPVNWISQLKRMNRKVEKNNGKTLNKGNIWYRKVCQFPEMNSGIILVVSFQLLPLVLVG